MRRVRIVKDRLHSEKKKWKSIRSHRRGHRQLNNMQKYKGDKEKNTS
jgi:hypothetical protein